MEETTEEISEEKRPAKKKAATKKKKATSGNGQARISVKLGLTISIGEFQSARVDAGLERDILAGTKDDVDKEFRKLWGIVEAQVDDKVSEIQEIYNGAS